MKVRDLASAQCGDKGNTSNAAVVADDEAAYEVLDEHLTADRLATELDGLIEGPVERYDLPQLGSFNFVIENALAGGVTKSLRMDGHGKSLSFAVLGIELDVDDSAPVDD
ncbi:hypothetical protein BRC68_03190 [Halobacteriales archaeon QH_6_64_20]|nr:MAG: hypothetical protein BRC68_03190 [Halobacteriales archaeon QH_6_64_20]